MPIGDLRVAPIQTLADLPNTTPIVIASHRVLGATRNCASGFKTVVPFAMLQVLARDAFPPHMFYDGLLDDLSEHCAEIETLNDRLADDRSRQVLAAVIAFRQTLDPAVLQPVVTDHDLYAPEGLFDFGPDEVMSTAVPMTATRSALSSHGYTTVSPRLCLRADP